MESAGNVSKILPPKTGFKALQTNFYVTQRDGFEGTLKAVL